MNRNEFKQLVEQRFKKWQRDRTCLFLIDPHVTLIRFDTEDGPMIITPIQAAYWVEYKKLPEKPVKRLCKSPDCINPGHLINEHYDILGPRPESTRTGVGKKCGKLTQGDVDKILELLTKHTLLEVSVLVDISLPTLRKVQLGTYTPRPG
jgi:hypothetical protein